jgi:hypothetical protein
LYADVTMRMGFDFKINLALPGAMPQLPFNEMLTQVKGDRGYAVFGPIVAVTDLSTGKIALLDAKTKRYASIAMADYLSKITGSGGEGAQAMQNMPEEAKQILANIKFDAESHDTGRTDRIQGIDAYEREVVIHMSIPVPLPGLENGLQVNLKMQVWKPKPSEFDRVPALRELAAYNERNKGFGDPSAALRQMFGALPGMGDHLGQMVEEMQKGGKVILGMRMGIYVPGLGAMLDKAGKGDAKAILPPEGEPLLSVNLDLKELSSATVPDAVFSIPAGYKEAPVEDLMKGLTSALTGGKDKEAPAPQMK